MVKAQALVLPRALALVIGMNLLILVYLINILKALPSHLVTCWLWSLVSLQLRRSRIMSSRLFQPETQRVIAVTLVVTLPQILIPPLILIPMFHLPQQYPLLPLVRVALRQSLMVWRRMVSQFPLSKQFIRNLMSQAGKNGSAYEVYKYDVHFKKDRNKRECMSLARVLDSLLAQDYKAAREKICRRLAGVHAADGSDNGDICDAFELVMERQSFVPDAHLQRAVKNVIRYKPWRRQGRTRREPDLNQPRQVSVMINRSRRGAVVPPPLLAHEGAPSTSRKKTQSDKGGSDE